MGAVFVQWGVECALEHSLLSTAPPRLVVVGMLALVVIGVEFDRLPMASL